jgi:hypothetical protein
VALDIAFFASISASVANQQTALTSIINMQDGASMKTIAFITMTFLPATFVATLFAMPMFQWNDKQDQIISRQFWLYWAVVIPLTFTVLLIWMGWWYWRSLRREFDNPKSSPLEDARDWLTTVLKKKPPIRVKRDDTDTSLQILEGNRMNSYLKEFYRTKKGSKGGTSRASHAV